MAIRLIRWGFEGKSVKHSSLLSKRFGMKILRLLEHLMTWLQIMQPLYRLEQKFLEWFDVLDRWPFLGPEGIETML
jgi:hypothetical protein